jgi:hypothetical protein
MQRRKCHRFPPGTSSKNPFREIPDKIQTKKGALRIHLEKDTFARSLFLHVN